MARGRFRQGHYQQGIGIPESLGVQPTTWTEPKEPKLLRTTWTSPSAGVSRNYGSTPSYVDTVPSRWNYGNGNGNFIKGLANLSARSQTSTSAPSSGGIFSTPPSGPPATGAGVPPSPPTYPAPTASAGVAVPPPPSSARKASSPPSPFATPPITTSGVPVPTAPASVRRAVKTTPLDVPPMGEQGSDILTASARVASGEPFTPNVQWRDEPENPFPLGSLASFETQRMFDPTYLPASQQATSSANSRAQNRRPKRI